MASHSIPQILMILSTPQIWDTTGPGANVATFKPLNLLEKGGITALAFAQNNSRLYSGASNGTVTAWHLEFVDQVGSTGVNSSRFL